MSVGEVIFQYRRPIAIGAGIVAGGAMLALARRAYASSQKSLPAQGVLKVKDGRQAVERYLRAAEEVSGIDGLTDFGLVAAASESNFFNTAKNTSSSEAEKACIGWERNKNTVFKGSPYNDREHFCWGSGGWYGLLPSTGMKALPFRDDDPLRAIFDPAKSTAMFTDFVARTVKGPMKLIPEGERNWFAMSRARSSLTRLYDTDDDSPENLRFMKRLSSSAKEAGVSLSSFDEAVDTSNYPGPDVVYDALKDMS